MGQIADFSRSDSAHFGSLCFQLRLFFKDHMQKTIEIDQYIEEKSKKKKGFLPMNKL